MSRDWMRFKHCSRASMHVSKTDCRYKSVTISPKLELGMAEGMISLISKEQPNRNQKLSHGVYPVRQGVVARLSAGLDPE